MSFFVCKKTPTKNKQKMSYHKKTKKCHTHKNKKRKENICDSFVHFVRFFVNKKKKQKLDPIMMSPGGNDEVCFLRSPDLPPGAWPPLVPATSLAAGTASPCARAAVPAATPARPAFSFLAPSSGALPAPTPLAKDAPAAEERDKR